ncbi:hypothetical protein [Butyrivibrio sp. LC3010]|uniref:hypothetical protein n=1 Tax=Butyrivibrio sp. LC3010 TaxID=1280680 RepID=UPI000416FAA3|nr:hypothetical protein [Butyrivibrio sp. LC3010]
MKAQKRGFFNFIFAFMPGAAEMYMGFMKMGISIMGSFMGMIGIIGFLGLSDAFMIIPVVLWFYAFFHARNLATCNPQFFMTVQDDYFWNELFGEKKINIQSSTARKIVAWVLIIAGLSIIWNMIMSPISEGLNYIADYTGLAIFEIINNAFYFLPTFIFAIVIVYIGIRLIIGKKKDLYITDKYMDSAPIYTQNEFTKKDDQEKGQGVI